MNTTDNALDLMLPQHLMGDLQSRLIGDRTRVRLVPLELINGGHAVRLIPHVPGSRLKLDMIDVSTLPIFDLAAAGIEFDRREDTIMREVRQRLSRWWYTWHTSHNVIYMAAQSARTKLYMGACLLQISFKSGDDFFDSSVETSVIRQAYTDLPKAKLWLYGRTLRGLDLSQPIEGLFGALGTFLIPESVQNQKGPLGEAFNAAERFFAFQAELRHPADEETIPQTGIARWWYQFSGAQKKSLARRERSRQKVFEMHRKFGWAMAQAA